jgi:uncharacterized membrane protein
MNNGRIAKIIGKVSVPCFLLGLLFFAASLTPSLIPRGPAVQGILGGLVMAIGYLIGQIVALLWRAADLPQLSGRPANVLTTVIALPLVAFFLWVLGSSLRWQNDIRGKMGMEEADALQLATILLIAFATFAVAFALGRVVAALFRLIRSRFYRVMPPRRANVLGFIAVVLILFVVTRDGIVDGVVTGLDESYEAAQELFENAPSPPGDPRMTGSAESLIDWASMGKPGRDFITSGPTSEDISAFTGRPALDPIRVYVGRANGETPEARAELALAELIRQGAFERDVLVAASPTGTGWMDPGSHDPVEYMHGGNIATVAAQYSYLQSPLALILETRTGLEQATRGWNRRPRFRTWCMGTGRRCPSTRGPVYTFTGLALAHGRRCMPRTCSDCSTIPSTARSGSGRPFPLPSGTMCRTSAIRAHSGSCRRSGTGR